MSSITASYHDIMADCYGYDSSGYFIGCFPNVGSGYTFTVGHIGLINDQDAWLSRWALKELIQVSPSWAMQVSIKTGKVGCIIGPLRALASGETYTR